MTWNLQTQKLCGEIKKTGNDPRRTRYGCFLPDLTGLARGTPVTSLPPLISDMFPQEATSFLSKLPMMPIHKRTGLDDCAQRKDMPPCFP